MGGNLAGRTFLVVGLGGLGSPLALALAAAGACKLLLVDDDVVDLSNLQRQILYRTADVGRPKVDAAREALERRGVAAGLVEALGLRVDRANALDLVRRADVVLDGSDNLETKFLVNDACVAAGRPFVIAGVVRHSGQVFPVRPRTDACYRCLFESPPQGELMTCADAGVFGATCGEVAGRQARAAIALATGRDPDGLLGRFWLFEQGQCRSFSVRPRPDCAACGRPRA